MNKLISGLSLGIVALLFASAGMAASVEVIPTTPPTACCSLTVSQGDTFTLTLHAVAFPGDGTTTGSTGSTLTINFDSNVVALTSAQLSSGSPLDFITPPTDNGPGSVIISALRNAAGYAFGDFNAYGLTFQVLNAAAFGSSANIVVFDDGLDNSWTDQDALAIPVTYTQATVTIGTPDITVADSDATPNDLTVDFGNVTVNSTASSTVTVTNDGTANLTLGAVAGVDGLAAPFAISADTCSSAVLAAAQPTATPPTPAGTCTITVDYTPTVAQTDGPDTFDIPSDDPDEGSVSVTVNGTGSAAANIVVTDSVVPNDDQDLPFGDVTVGTSAPVATVTITNGGAADLTIGTLTSPAAPFSLANDMCSGQVLPATVQCTVEVHYDPADPADLGNKSSSFDIPSDDPDSPTVTVSMSGNGIAPPTPDIAVTDSVAPVDDHSIDFTSWEVGQTSTPQTITVTNNGTVDLTVSSITGLAAPFSVTAETCTAAPIAASATCTITLEFAPTSAVLSNGTLTIASDDPDTPSVDVTVSGTGTPPPTPDIAVTDSLAPPDDHIVPFGSVLVGQASAVATVTVTNNGTADLTVSSITAPAAPFSVTAETCTTAPIAASGTCTVSLQFSPTAAGPANGTLAIASDDPDTPAVNVAVSGTGTAPEISVSSLAVDFGDVAPGDTASQVITVTNTGAAPLDVGAVTAPATAQFTITGDTCSTTTVAAAGTCTITVQFAPDAEQAYSDSIDIPSNDADEATVTVDLSGTGKESGIPGLSGGSSLDLETLLGLGLLGYALKRRRRA